MTTLENDQAILAAMVEANNKPQPAPTVEHLQRYIDALHIFLADANEEIIRLRAQLK